MGRVVTRAIYGGFVARSDDMTRAAQQADAADGAFLRCPYGSTTEFIQDGRDVERSRP